MAKQKIRTPYSNVEYEKHVDSTFQALILQNITDSGSNENPHETFNRLVKEERRLQLYKKGETRIPKRAYSLHVEAERRISHSVKLNRNMRAANPTISKAEDHDAHHIVAARVPEAGRSRKILFEAEIGINDARNGVFLHKIKHKALHSANARHYALVNFRLIQVEGEGNKLVGEELMELGEDIVEGLI